ncbi:histidine kinase-like ATPase, partial [Ochromonadaceae sp. CCMP2298]
PVKFRGDPLRIGQILINLTSNAIKFTEHGEVVVDVKVTKKNNTHNLVTFTITDQGIGISPAQQQKLFSAFTQAHSSTTRHYGGTGLGLVICKNLVELMGGKIHISSELGVGTKVSFSIEFEQFGGKQIINKRISNNTKLQDTHVLIVEDNAINQQITAEFLKQSGIKYDIVKNGKEAIEHIQKYQYDAVLMDLQMPIMGGIEATEIIRTLPEGKLLPIIAMTANAMQQHKQECLDAGMNSHIAKPIDVDQLYSTLEQ